MGSFFLPLKQSWNVLLLVQATPLLLQTKQAASISGSATKQNDTNKQIFINIFGAPNLPR